MRQVNLLSLQIVKSRGDRNLLITLGKPPVEVEGIRRISGVRHGYPNMFLPVT